MKHIIVLGAQVPFVHSGAEILNESLAREINKIEGLRAELVQLPFKWYPDEQILNDIMAWRMLDLTESNGIKIDLVIATKFPTYALNHSNKVLWLVHQHRSLYDLANTDYNTLKKGTDSIQKKLIELDNKFILECKKVFTIADTVSNRLKKYNHVESEVLSPPPALANTIHSKGYGDYIFCVGRLDPLKRVDLLIESIKSVPNAKILIAGKGSEYNKLEDLIKKYNLQDRCKLLGYIGDEELLDYLSDARAVYYGPLDEDYGYATIEALLAKKPVITCEDSGEVTSIVRKTQGGIICKANPSSISEAISKIYRLSDKELENMVQSGYQFAKKIRWKHIIQKLVLDNLS